MSELKLDALTIGINIDMQKFYDDLVIYKKSIEAQLAALAKEPAICTHRKTEDFDGITVCANKHCRKTINLNGLHDWCSR